EPVLLRRVDHAVPESLSVVACEEVLNSGEVRADEVLALVPDGLANALGHRDLGALELDDPESEAVDVEHHVRALVVLPEDSNFFGKSKVIGRRRLPVD